MEASSLFYVKSVIHKIIGILIPLVPLIEEQRIQNKILQSNDEVLLTLDYEIKTLMK